jgi:hypothetical protein
VLEGERQGLDPRHPQRTPRLHGVQGKPGLRGALVGPHRVVEDVVEGAPQPVERLGGAVDRQGVAAAHREDPQVVDAVDVVGVLVGVEHRVHLPDAGREELEPQLGRSIEQDGAAVGLEEGAGAGAPVPRIVGAADRAVAPDLGHTERGAGAEKGEPHRQTASILSRLVVPGMSNGTPAVTTSRSPGRASPRARISPRATPSISS